MLNHHCNGFIIDNNKLTGVEYRKKRGTPTEIFNSILLMK